MSLVRYELGFYIQEDGILHSHRRGNLRCYIEALAFPRQSSHTRRRDCHTSARAGLGQRKISATYYC
jgi:hypothetical protein